MLKDERARRLATEFAGNWLDFRRFDEHNAVDRERFPSSATSCARRCSRSRSGSSSDVVRNDRSVLDMLYGNHTFVNPVLAKHYGMPEVDGSADTMGPRRQRAPVSARRPAADGGVPDAERARPADEPGEARILGRAARARRDDSAAAADGARAAEGRGEAGPAAAGDAGETSRQRRRARPAMRASIPSGWRSKATARSAKRGRKTSPGGPSTPRRLSPAAARAPASQGCRAYIRANRQKDFMDNLSRKMLAYALGRSLQLSDEPPSSG